MANRKLDLEKFLDAIPAYLLTEYFDKKRQEKGVEMDILVEEINRRKIPFRDDESREQLSMRMFL